MRNEEVNTAKAAPVVTEMNSQSRWINKEYHELADVPVRESDLLDQVRRNLTQLQDLQSRFGFVLREIQYLTKGG